VAVQVLKLDDLIKGIAIELKEAKSLLLLGRGYQFAACVEGALVRSPSLYSLCLASNLSRIHSCSVTSVLSHLCASLTQPHTENQGACLHAQRGYAGR
jgi:hypothetical protein